MKQLRWRAAGAFALGLAATSGAAPTRILHGEVTLRGEPVQRAVVKLENSNTLVVRSFITGPDGHYHFANLSPDIDYRVWARRGDKDSSKEILSKFNSDQRPTLNLKLE